MPIREPKKSNRKIFFAKACLDFQDNFDHSIFIDESTVQLNKNASKIWYRVISGETRLGLIGRNKHAPSLHIIGGISRKGRTQLVIFEGMLNAKKFQRISRMFLIPFIERNSPDHHRLHMDNAPCHTAATTQRFLINNNINHYKTPAQSPDLMPIELVWHDLKKYLSETIKPETKVELINGIEYFWNNIVTIDYCNSKINHLNRVLKQVIILNGLATGM